MNNIPGICIKEGILFEDNGQFLKWDQKISKLEAENPLHVEFAADRTIYYWGKHKILNGLELELQSFYWKYKVESFNKKFKSIEFKVVGDKISEEYFDLISKHIEGLFGNGVRDIVSDSDKLIEWKIDGVSLSLLLFEQFVYKLCFKISKD